MGQNNFSLLPVEEELRERISWLIRLRWIALAGILVSVWATRHLLHALLPEKEIYLVCLAILLYNALFLFYLRRIEKGDSSHSVFSRFATIQILTDWVALTLLIHYTGGIESPVILYFFFHVLISFVLLPPRIFYIQASIAVFLLGAVAILEYHEIIGHITLRGFITHSNYRNPLYVSGVLFFFATALYVSTYLSTSIMKRLRDRDRRLITLQNALKNAYQRMQTLYDLSRNISSTLELKEVLGRLAQNATEVMNAKGCSVRLWDKTHSRLELGAAYGLSKEYLEKGPVDADKSLIEALKGKPVSVADVTKDTRVQYHEEAKREGIASMIGAPLVFKEKIIGTLRIHMASPHDFSEEEKEFVSAIASTVGIAIANAMAYKKLLEFDEARSRFMMIVAHEMRAPVTAIQGILRTVLDGYLGELSPKQRELLSRAEVRTHSFLVLINDLLALGADETEEVKDKVTPTSIDEALRKVLGLLEVKSKEKNISVEVEAPEIFPVIREIEGDMEKLFTNLIGNAVKYTPPGGKVWVRIGVEDKLVKIVVSDTGIGISSEDLPHVFEEFYRAKNARELIREGTGLGLTIVKRIVDRYNGRISVDSKPNEGTTFTVLLPGNKVKIK
ncbi:MAG: GAF domain-containing sensor histidine kinase [Syntrophales bacterium]|nr:GAF domain-containing sensor histidine kinase [Syntrophales bacterium]